LMSEQPRPDHQPDIQPDNEPVEFSNPSVEFDAYVEEVKQLIKDQKKSAALKAIAAAEKFLKDNANFFAVTDSIDLGDLHDEASALEDEPQTEPETEIGEEPLGGAEMEEDDSEKEQQPINEEAEPKAEEENSTPEQIIRSVREKVVNLRHEYDLDLLGDNPEEIAIERLREIAQEYYVEKRDVLPSNFASALVKKLREQRLFYLGQAEKKAQGGQEQPPQQPPPPEQPPKAEDDNDWPPKYLTELLELMALENPRIAAYETELRGLDYSVSQARINAIEADLNTNIDKIVHLQELVNIHVEHANERINSEQVNRLVALRNASRQAEDLLEKMRSLLKEIDKKKEEAEAKKETDQWNADVKLFVDEIEKVEAIDLNNIAPHSSAPGAHEKDDLEALKTNLENAYKAIDAAGYLDQTNYSHSSTTDAIEKLVGPTKLGGRYGEAVRRINEAIETAKSEVLKTDQIKKMDELWQMLEDNDKMRGTRGDNKVTDAVDAMKRIAKEHFNNEEERELLDISILLRDAVDEAGGSDWPALLAWADVTKAREAAGSFILMDHLRKFRHFGDFAIKDKLGVEHKINIKEVVDFLRNELFNGPFTRSRKHDADVQDEKDRHWNYAAKGNPTGNLVYDEHTNPNGVFTINQVLEREFPELAHFPDFIKLAMRRFVVVSEMRSDAYIPEYAMYQGSPVPGFDATASADASPMAAILYKAQSGASLPKYRVYSMVTRLPEKVSSITRYSLPIPSGLPSGFRSWMNKTFSPLKEKFSATEVVYERSIYAAMEPPNSTEREKKSSNKSVKNLETFVMVRNRMIADFSPYGIDYVQLHEDLKFQPTLWDWINGQWRGEKMKDVPTYYQFRTMQEEIREFDKFVDGDFGTIHSVDQLDTAMGQLVDRIKNFKGMWICLPKGERTFANTIQLMSVVYLKKIYNKYSALLGEGVPEGAPPSVRFRRENLKPKAKRFAEVAQKVLGSAATLPQEVYSKGDHPLQKVIEQLDGWHSIGRPWRLFFDDEREVRSHDLSRTFENMWGPEFKTIYDNWLREPTIEEQDPNK